MIHCEILKRERDATAIALALLLPKEPYCVFCPFERTVASCTPFMPFVLFVLFVAFVPFVLFVAFVPFVPFVAKIPHDTGCATA